MSAPILSDLLAAFVAGAILFAASGAARAASPDDRWLVRLDGSVVRASEHGVARVDLSRLDQRELIGAGTQYPDLGLTPATERPRARADGYGLQWGPTLQLEMGRALVDANVWLRRASPLLTDPAMFSYQWQARTPIAPHLEFGAMGYGNVGLASTWAQRNEQEHVAGPALFTRFPVGGGRSVGMDAAVMSGLTAASSRYTFRLRASLQF